VTVDDGHFLVGVPHFDEEVPAVILVRHLHVTALVHLHSGLYHPQEYELHHGFGILHAAMALVPWVERDGSDEHKDYKGAHMLATYLAE
jgi:hypothetical protein